MRLDLLPLSVWALLAVPSAATAIQEPGEAREAASAPAVATHPGASLRVYLLTVGQGDLVWEKFGHNAIRIVDVRDGTDVAWNWGMFDFSQENFWPRLVKGEMLYGMAGYATDRTLHEYTYFDRAVWSQELALTPEQRWRLREAVLEHYRPENREYLYDYYRDNCSTRVRDMLDLALGGALRAELAEDTTSTTFRWHTRRLLARSPLAYTGIQLVLGNPADRRITRWEEAFLPMRLQAHLRDVTVTGPDGTARPLVAREVRLVESARPPALERAPSRLGWFAGIGLALAALMALLAVRADARSVPGRVLFVALAGLWSLLAGVGGLLVLGAWLFTGHDFWGWNENLLQTSPLSLAVLLGLVPVLWRGHLGERTVTLAALVAGLSALGFLVQPLPGLDQANGEIIALALPVNLGLAWAARVLARPGPAPSGETGAASARAA